MCVAIAVTPFWPPFPCRTLVPEVMEAPWDDVVQTVAQVNRTVGRWILIFHPFGPYILAYFSFQTS